MPTLIGDKVSFSELEAGMMIQDSNGAQITIEGHKENQLGEEYVHMFTEGTEYISVTKEDWPGDDAFMLVGWR